MSILDVVFHCSTRNSKMSARYFFRLVFRESQTAVPFTRGNNSLKNYSCLFCTRLRTLYSPESESRIITISRQYLSTTVSRSQSLSHDEVRKSMDRLTEKFMEAKELLEDARESVGTVYFSDDMLEAEEAVTETLEEYQSLLKSLSEEQKQDVVRTIGLRMEELKAQGEAIKQDLE